MKIFSVSLVVFLSLFFVSNIGLTTQIIPKDVEIYEFPLQQSKEEVEITNRACKDACELAFETEYKGRIPKFVFKRACMPECLKIMKCTRVDFDLWDCQAYGEKI